jgi:hypothetical protein
VIVGGWAVNNYLIPRVTGDIDFFVSRSSKNQSLIRKALIDFGFQQALPEETVELIPPKKILMLGRQPNRIDIISEIDGVTFKDAWEKRVKGEIDGLQVNFISPELLLVNKRSTGRLKDKADAEGLEKLLVGT